MKYLITVFFTISIFLSQAQNASLKGKVLQHSFKIRKEERKTPPVASVEVKSSWANPKTTQTDGSFHLIFHDLEPGEVVNLSVKKEGYEVVNTEKLNTNIPNDPDKQLLTIYLVKAQLLADARSKYYNIAKTNMQKGLEKQIAQLNKENENYKTERQRLQEEKKNLPKAARDLADKFARETFVNADSIYIKAFETYQSGDINGAIAILTSVDSYKERQKAVAQLKKAKEIQNIGIEMEAEAMKVIAQSIKNLQLTAQVYVSKYQIDSAFKYYEQAVLLDSNNFDNVKDFVDFLHKYKRYQKATDWAEHALTISQTPADSAAIQNKLGLLYRHKNYDKAEEYLLKSLAIREQLAEKKPDAYLDDLATSQNDLGAFYKLGAFINNSISSSITTNLDILRGLYKAEEYLLKSLAIREELAKKEPDVYLYELTITQHHLGTLYKSVALYGDKSQYDKAEQYLLKSLAIYEQLAKKEPYIYIDDLATIQNSLAGLYKDKHQYDKVEEYYLKSLAIREELANKEPDAYLDDLSGTQTDLGVLYHDQNQYDKAEEYFLKSLAIREELANKEPEFYLDDLGSIQNYWGILYFHQNQYDKAEEYLLKSLAIREELANKEPEVYLGELATTQSILGALYHHKNQYDKAKQYYLKCLAICEELAKKEPDIYPDLLTSIQNNLRILYRHQNQYDNVLDFSEGLAAVALNGKWGYINVTGEVVIPIQYYDYAGIFLEGLARVKLNDKYGYINKTGEVIIPIQYDEASRFYEGLAAVALNGKWGYINVTGEEITPIQYDEAWAFSEGLARVKLNGKWGYINKTGEVIIPIQYDEASGFSKGLAKVKLNGKYGYINVTGEVVILIQYDEAWAFSEGLARVKLNGKWGYINKTDEVVIPIQYDEASGFSEGLAGVELNGKWGYINKTGEVIIPIQYDDARRFSYKRTARVELNGERFRINKEGKRID